MSYNRYKDILKAFQLSAIPSGDQPDDPWWHVRGFIDHLNEDRARNVSPGPGIVTIGAISIHVRRMTVAAYSIYFMQSITKYVYVAYL